MSRGRTVPVLMYHHVTPAGGHVSVTPEHFRDQLAWLRRHRYRSLTGDEFAAHLGGRAAPARSLLLTFDDGYLDNFVHAWPLLREYGFHALVFLVTSWLGDGPPRSGLLSDPSALAGLNHRECMRRVAAGQAHEVALRWSEVRQMQVDGVCEFHSHTHTHTRWDRQPVDKNAAMRSELLHSRQCLDHELGRASEHLCWPQGYFDPEYVAIARGAGFRYLYTTRAFGRNRPGTDPASIFRFAVRDTSGASVGRRIRVAESPWMAPAFNAWKKWKRGERYPG